MITYETLKTFCADDEPMRPQMTFACRRADGWWATDGTRIICVPMEECQQGDVRFLCDEIPADLVERFPKVENVVNVEGFTSKFLVPVKAIEDAMAKLPLTDEMVEVEREMKFIDCPECGGDGEVEITDTIHFHGHWYHVEATAECPICHGYGKIPDTEDYNPKDDDYDPDSPEYSTMVPTGRKVPDVSHTLLHIKDNGYFKADFFNDLLRVAREQQVTEIECHGSNYRNIILFRLHGVVVGLMPTLNVDGKSDSIDVEL